MKLFRPMLSVMLLALLGAFPVVAQEAAGTAPADSGVTEEVLVRLVQIPLTARDRPYKRALPPERALEILGYEVKDGHIDPELVRIFQEAGVYLVTENERGG